MSQLLVDVERGVVSVNIGCRPGPNGGRLELETGSWTVGVAIASFHLGGKFKKSRHLYLTRTQTVHVTE